MAEEGRPGPEPLDLTPGDEEAEKPDDPDADVLRGRIAVLEAENERLRQAYARTRRSAYRRTAVALVAVGLVGFAGGILAPSRQTILFALGGTGVFLGILTFALTPERFVPVDVGRAVYKTLAANVSRLAGELGLSDGRVYIPHGDGSPERVTLFVPQSDGAPLPDQAALGETLVVTDGSRGLAVEPAGSALFDRFRTGRTENLPSAPESLGRQLAEALVAQFELAGSVEAWVSPETTAERGQLTAAVADSSYGPVGRFDHPVASFLAVGLARTLSVPVALSVTESDDPDADVHVTCRWPADIGERDAE